jgi:hypothetical protein
MPMVQHNSVYHIDIQYSSVEYYVPQGWRRGLHVDLEFLKEQRIEIDAILAQVGDERFWEYIMYKLKQL